MAITNLDEESSKKLKRGALQKPWQTENNSHHAWRCSSTMESTKNLSKPWRWNTHRIRLIRTGTQMERLKDGLHKLPTRPEFRYSIFFRKFEFKPVSRPIISRCEGSTESISTFRDTVLQPVKWYMKCFIYWTADLKSSELWSSQLWTQFKKLRIEAWKNQDFNGVWTRDLAIPVRHSNQLSYEATDVGSWSFVSSNEPVKNRCEVIYEMFHILNCGFEKDNPLQI